VQISSASVDLGDDPECVGVDDRPPVVPRQELTDELAHAVAVAEPRAEHDHVVAGGKF